MGKCFTGWFDYSIKVWADFVLNKICDIFSMIWNIILDDSNNDRAKSTIIIKSTEVFLIRIFRWNEIHICAFLIQYFDIHHNLLELIFPIFLVACRDNKI
jgi:hypothetical protein